MRLIRRTFSTSAVEFVYDAVSDGAPIGYMTLVGDVDDRAFRIGSVQLWPYWRYKGFGERMYKEAARRVEAMGGVLMSSVDRSSDAERLWCKLCRKGLATFVVPAGNDEDTAFYRFLTKEERRGEARKRQAVAA